MAWERMRRALAFGLLSVLDDWWLFSWRCWVVRATPSVSLRCCWEPSSCFLWPLHGLSVLFFALSRLAPQSVWPILSHCEGTLGQGENGYPVLHRCGSPAQLGRAGIWSIGDIPALGRVKKWCASLVVGVNEALNSVSCTWRHLARI